MKILFRRKVISEIVDYFKFNSYLEIGLRNPDSVFNYIKCKIKYSVDIDPSAKASYCGSSDLFFAQSKIADIKWDCIFIDAWHIADFVYRDLINSVKHLNDGGVIFLHDVLPTKYEYTLENGDIQCQSAWKVIPYVLKYCSELRICSIVDGNAGLGVVVKGNRTETLDINFNQFYDYYLMDKNRKLSQNVINYSDLIKWIKNENV
jgi:hypothetical protein